MTTLGFECQWFETVSGIMHTLFLKYFLDNDTIEILLNNAHFLKRIYYPDVKLSDLYIGNTITVHNRQIVIKKYANIATEKYMAEREIRFLCVVAGDDFNKLGRLLTQAKEAKLIQNRTATSGKAIDIEDVQIDRGDFVIELVGLEKKVSQNFSSGVKSIANSIRTFSLSAQSIEKIFQGLKSIDVFGSSTLCIIKPHVIKQQRQGELIQHIANSGFTIVGLTEIHLTNQFAEELFEVYKGVIDNYSVVIEHICSSPCIALMIQGKNDNIVEEFREFAGPYDPQLAKTLRPQSLRSLFGMDLIRNGVHCTDLNDDGNVECKYIFETLAGL